MARAEPTFPPNGGARAPTETLAVAGATACADCVPEVCGGAAAALECGGGPQMRRAPT